MRKRLAATTLIVTLASSSSSLPASAAPEVNRCIEASERGQVARKKHQLMSARTAFLECAAPACPAVVRTACADWLKEVEAAVPSIVIAVESDEGGGAAGDIATARVTVDDEPLQAQGVAIMVDPGPHVVRVRADGYIEREMTIVAREGDHHRAVQIKLTKDPGAAAPTTAQPPPKRDTSEKPDPNPNPSSSSHSPSTETSPITWIAGGAAIAALGSFAFFGLSARADAADLRETCAPRCPESDRDNVQTRYIVADVSLVVAAVLGAVAVVTYFRAR